MIIFKKFLLLSLICNTEYILPIETIVTDKEIALINKNNTKPFS